MKLVDIPWSGLNASNKPKKLHPTGPAVAPYEIYDKHNLISTSYGYTIDTRDHSTRAYIIKIGLVKLHAVNILKFLKMLETLPEEQRHGYVFMYKQIIKDKGTRTLGWCGQYYYTSGQKVAPGMCPVLIDKLPPWMTNRNYNGQNSQCIRVFGRVD